MRYLLTTALICLFAGIVNAQVKTNFNNPEQIGRRGKFLKNFRAESPYVIPARDIKILLRQDSLERLSGEARPFKIAEALPVDIDLVKVAEWVEESGMAYGKFTVVAASAKSISANFDKFYLPEGTELYAYSENGEMITGPITEDENNENNFWGTWVYKGSKLTIEVRTPSRSRDELQLHISSVGYGYKNLYRTEVSNFGESSSCNINVLCEIGDGWENERNSVSLILNSCSTALCSGALVNNTCNLNIPYLLTADHCFAEDGNVAQWKFTFQAWSATCTPSQNATGITFNGSALRARSAGTDFCLLQLSQTPPANSNITYAGWSRNTTGITQGTIIHHPAGDVMKISRDDQAPILATHGGAATWKLVLDHGATNGGSSGSPYFDQNHRIFAQHKGIDNQFTDDCLNTGKFGGRFAVSWDGLGTNTTRLSNWLDPLNTGAMTTNTINVANTIADPRIVTVSPSSAVCTGGSQFTLHNVPTGAVVTWTATPANLFAVSSGTGAIASLAAANSSTMGTGTLAFTVNIGCGTPVQAQRTVWVGKPDYNNLTLTVDSDDLSNCDYTYAHAGTNYPGPSMSITAYEWRIPYSSDWDIYEEYGGIADFQWVEIEYYDQYPPYQEAIQVRAYNTCGWSYWEEFWVAVDDCAYAAFTFGPNPAVDELTISKKDSGPSEIVIHNSSMEQVYSLASSDDIVKIPVKGFPEGVYYLQVATKKGTIRERILIKR
ncbi:MAG TPA: trypsin-like peptidase domain-containing protein [Ohtaekwangia sp.]|nr:trypsin-like peptidase domain-containing protein [Ohtaekwangia sp.]